MLFKLKVPFKPLAVEKVSTYWYAVVTAVVETSAAASLNLPRSTSARALATSTAGRTRTDAVSVPAVEVQVRRYIVPFVVLGMVLFASGMFMGYKVTPLAIKFMLGLAGKDLQTGPGASRTSSARVASPEVTIFDQAARDTPRPSSCSTIGPCGRGALEIRITGPRSALNRAMASQARGKLSRPLCTTPQTSQSSTS